MIERRKQCIDPLIADAALHRNCPLPRRRGKGSDIHQLGNNIRKAETAQASIGEERRINVARAELAQARFDIAAKIDDLEIGTGTADQCLPPQGSRADYSPVRQIKQPLDIPAYKCIARVFTLQEDREMQALRQEGGHVL